MTYFLEKERNHDVEFVIGEKSEIVPANSTLLASCSEVFERIFFDDRFPRQLVDGVHRIEERDVTTEVFETFKRFVYTDELTLTNENVLPLYSLADKYAVLSLRLKTVDYFKAMLVPSDALAVLTAVSCYPELREICLCFIDHTASDVLANILGPYAEVVAALDRSDLQAVIERDSLGADEADVYRFTIYWAELQLVKKRGAVTPETIKAVLVHGEDSATLGRRIRGELGDAIRLVRFTQMSHEKVKRLSRIHEILDTDELIQIGWLSGFSVSPNEKLLRMRPECGYFHTRPRPGPFRRAQFVVKRCRRCLAYHEERGRCPSHGSPHEYKCPSCSTQQQFPLTSGRTVQCACGIYIYCCTRCEAVNSTASGEDDEVIRCECGHKAHLYSTGSDVCQKSGCSHTELDVVKMHLI
ncbi:BTB/POZ domain-containing protein 2-like protein [Aphelenchoides avenae]|nr:BTB/POZ domain-containing protein 2-like protein [Aphelenchus avenae]